MTQPRTRPENWQPSWGPAPRLATPRTPERPTYGPQVAKIAELLGTPLFPQQKYVFDVALEVQSEEAGDPVPGAMAYDEVLDSEPRRSGKTFKIGPLVAYVCSAGDRRQAWMTAQNRDRANRRWEDVKNQLDDDRSPLAGKLRVKEGNSGQRITWKETGSLFLPFSPNAKALHGEDPDLVLVDELWSFDLEQKATLEEAYEPAGAVKQLQVWKMSAAGTEASTWLNAERSRAEVTVPQQYEDPSKRLGAAFFDWSVPDEVGGVEIGLLPNDELLDVVLECHPRRDTGLRATYLASQLDKRGRDDFLRGFGNRTVKKSANTIIPATALARSLTHDRIPPAVRVGLGVSVDRQRRVAVSAAWRNPAGLATLEVIHTQDGVRGAAEFVRDLVARNEPGAVGVNYVGAAVDLADQIEALDVELMHISGSKFQAAWTRLHEGMTTPHPTVTHLGEPVFHEALAAAGLRKMPRGDTVPESQAGEPITVLEAHISALWAHDHMPPAVRKFKIA